MVRTCLLPAGGLFLGLMLLSGCGESAGDRHAVKGTVTFKGQPLDQGRIEFSRSEKEAPVTGANIENGKYTVPSLRGLPPGNYRVAIWSNEGGKVPAADQLPGEPPPPSKERIPAKYNSQSTLKADVKSGTDVLDFKLD